MGTSRRWRTTVACVVSLWAVALTAMAGGGANSGQSGWFDAGTATPLPAEASFANAGGRVGVLFADGPVATGGHPFFVATGTNGRAASPAISRLGG